MSEALRGSQRQKRSDLQLWRPRSLPLSSPMGENGWVEPQLEAAEVSTWKVLLVLLSGAAFGALVIFGDSFWWDEQHRTFSRDSGPFTLWAALMCAQTGLWALALGWLAPSVRRLHRLYGDANRQETVVSTAIILVVIVLLAVVAPLFSSRPDYVPHHTVKLGFLTLVGALVGLVAAEGIWLVRGGLASVARDGVSERALERFQFLQSELRRFLGTLGAILGLLVLATAAQRHAVLDYAPNANYDFELVLVYGLFFSILIGAIYLPAHLTLMAVGDRLRDSFFPALAPAAAEWEERTRRREQFGRMLELDVGPFGRLSANAAILTPLIGSLIALVFK